MGRDVCFCRLIDAGGKTNGSSIWGRYQSEVYFLRVRGWLGWRGKVMPSCGDFCAWMDSCHVFHLGVKKGGLDSHSLVRYRAVRRGESDAERLLLFFRARTVMRGRNFRARTPHFLGNVLFVPTRLGLELKESVAAAAAACLVSVGKAFHVCTNNA